MVSLDKIMNRLNSRIHRLKKKKPKFNPQYEFPVFFSEMANLEPEKSPKSYLGELGIF